MSGDTFLAAVFALMLELVKPLIEVSKASQGSKKDVELLLRVILAYYKQMAAITVRQLKL